MQANVPTKIEDLSKYFNISSELQTILGKLSKEDLDEFYGVLRFGSLDDDMEFFLEPTDESERVRSENLNKGHWAIATDKESAVLIVKKKTEQELFEFLRDEISDYSPALWHKIDLIRKLELKTQAPDV